MNKFIQALEEAIRLQPELFEPRSEFLDSLKRVNNRTAQQQYARSLNATTMAYCHDCKTYFQSSSEDAGYLVIRCDECQDKRSEPQSTPKLSYPTFSHCYIIDGYTFITRERER